MTERRERTPLTLAHLHIPKTAGTSLNAAVAESLGVREVYFHRVGAHKSDEATLRLPRSGPARELVLCYPFFSGHMSIGQLQALNRQRIFSILTDPRIRLVKQFTWVAQAGRIQNCSILEWLKITFAASPEHSSPTLHLIHHGPRPHDRLKRAGLGDRRSSKRWIPNTEDDFRTLTESLVTVVTESPQEALNYLVNQELLPRLVQVPHLNARPLDRDDRARLNSRTLPHAEAVMEQLKLCTTTEYRFLNYLEKSGRHYFNLSPVGDDAIASLLLARGLAH